MKEIYYLTAIMLVSTTALSARAAESDADKYRQCMNLLEKSGAEAVAYADNWAVSGFGGVPAGHCKALGLLNIGKPAEAAKLLEKLVDDMAIGGAADAVDSPDSPARAKRARLTVQLYIQAALAWKAADETDKAYMAYSAALSGVTPGGPYAGNPALLHELYLERGTLQIRRRQYKAAAADLTLAIEQDDRGFEAYLQRAKAYRKKQDYLKAAIDLKVAGKIAADHPDILLEQGILYRAQNRKLAAERVWRRIIELHPESEMATIAATNIDLLSVE